MDKKKRLILIGLLISLFIGVIIFIILVRPGEKPSVPPSLRPTATAFPTQFEVTQFPSIVPVTPSEVGKINIVGVEVNDFIKTAKMVNSAGDVLIESNNEFQMVYLPAFTQFIITAFGPNYNQSRQKAERELLKRLGISEDKACRLTVFVTFMDPADPRAGDKGNYNLSFCEHEP